MKTVYAFICLAFTFSSLANAKVIIHKQDITDNNHTSVTMCDQISQTMLLLGKLKVTSNGCSFTITKKIAEESGYTLGELQKLILDYTKNDSYEVTIQPLVKGDVISIGVNTVAK